MRGTEFLGSPLPGNLMLTAKLQEVTALGQEIIRHISPPVKAQLVVFVQIKQPRY